MSLKTIYKSLSSGSSLYRHAYEEFVPLKTLSSSETKAGPILFHALSFTVWQPFHGNKQIAGTIVICCSIVAGSVIKFQGLSL